MLDTLVHVSTLIGDLVIVNQVYHACSICSRGYYTWVDLVILDMVDFDIILGISWSSAYHMILDYAKTIIGYDRMDV